MVVGSHASCLPLWRRAAVLPVDGRTASCPERRQAGAVKLSALHEIITDLIANGARDDHEVFLHIAIGDAGRQRVIDSGDWTLAAVHVADSDGFVVLAGAPEPL
jgi:hypothetical protein